MRVFCCWIVLATATMAWAQNEPCLAGTQDPGCGITVTTNPPLTTEENVFWVPNQITVEVPARLHATRVVVLSGPTGTGVADQFKPFVETKHYQKDGANMRFKVEVKSCPGSDNAFNVGIYSPRFPYPLSVLIQPFECKPQAGR